MGFLHPWFLLLGLGIVIPIAVHLFNFHRFKEVLFTNVAFLKQISIQNKQRNKLLERLLLLCRCLVILFLALLFSQPYIKHSEDQLASSEGNNAVVIIVDNSFSMQNTSSKGSLLQNAKAKATEILNEYTDNDVFCLLTQDREGRHKHFVTKQTFREFLKDVAISSCSEPYSELINTAHRLLSLRNESSKRMFLIADFQSSNFDAERIKADTNVRDIFVPLLPQNINNLFVDSLSLGSNIFLKDQKVDLTVRIRNASDENVEKLTVKLFVNDKQQSLSSCDIQANSYADVPMSFVIENTGRLCGRIHIIDNPITYDDDFYFTLNVGEKIRLLSLNGSGENPFLARLFKHSSEAETDDMSEKNIDFSVFKNYDVIVLNGLNQITSGLAQELNRQKQKGITLVIIPDKDMDIDSYKRAMTLMHLPTYVSKVTKRTKVTQLDDKNKLFNRVFSAVSDNMEMPQSNIYFKISSASAISRQDIMNYADNDAFLTVSGDNQSETYIFSTPFTKEATDFVSQSLFVPIVWNIALYSKVMLQPYSFMNENSFVDISALTDTVQSEILSLQSLENPSVEIIPQMQRINGRNGFTINRQIKTAGFFAIKDGQKHIGILAMNYPRQESVLRFLSKKDIERQLQAVGYRNYDVFNDKKMIKTYFAQSKKGFDFTVLLLALIIAALVGETIVILKLKNNKLKK